MNRLFDWLKRSSRENRGSYVLEKDLDEFRKWDLVADYVDAEEAIRDFPDFYVPYIHAAYPTRMSEDHASANPEYLIRAIGKVNAESYIRARLSCYYIWAGEFEKAFREAVQYFLMTKNVPVDRPGDYSACIVLVSNLLAMHGFQDQSKRLADLDTGCEFSEEEAGNVAKAASALSNRKYRSMVQEACHVMANAGYFS